MFALQRFLEAVASLLMDEKRVTEVLCATAV
jgi:hypothetical protein